MQNLQQKFNDLKPSEKILLVFSILLLTFVLTKLLIIDKQKEKLENLQNRASLISQQANLLIQAGSENSSIQKKQTNELVSDFLRRHNSSDKLKNIRSTTNGSQRYELENIPFNTLLNLLTELSDNGSQHSMLQIKENKIEGTVNTVLVSN